MTEESVPGTGKTLLPDKFSRPIRRWRRVIGSLLVIAAFLVGIVWFKFFRIVPVHYESAEEHFKYGSIGVEAPAGIPYWIWLVLPRIFPEKLPGPGGYVSLGVSWEEGQELPVGFTKVTIGFPRVGVNCANCHTTSVRATPRDKPVFYLGGPSSRYDPQAYVRFLFACAKDPRFNADTIMKEINYIIRLSWLDRLIYRYILIPRTKRGLLKAEKDDYYWMSERPDWGPGRTDMNPFQRQVMRLPDDHSIGSTDIMAVWNERAHEGYLRHSDGLNTTLVEAVRSAALAAGASKKSIDIHSLDRVQAWLMELPSPKYPFPLDAALASRGCPLFDAQCATCHAFSGARTGSVIPVSEVGTDGHRVDHWPKSSAETFNRYATGLPWAFHNFRSSNGYVALPLDGIWLRAPYLHNGSVSSLKELLKRPVDRLKVFYRGYDVYDQANAGFVVSGMETERMGFRYDTRIPGNSNQGHSYGTDLPTEDKQALIEFLKTL
jgi:mono/diheme cytochrome c family protein